MGSWDWLCAVNSSSTTPSNASSGGGGLLADECFVDGVVSIPPLAFSALAVIVLTITRCCCKGGSTRPYIIRYPGHTPRWIFSLIAIVLSVAAIGEGILSEELYHAGANRSAPHLYINGVCILVASLFSIVYYHWMEVWRRRHMAWLLVLFWSVSIATMSYRIHHFINIDANDVSIFRFDLTIALLTVYCILFLIEMRFIARVIIRYRPEIDALHPDLKKPNMKYYAKYSTILSEMVFWWENWVFMKGYKKVLSVEDLGSIPETHTSSHNHKRFKTIFMREKAKMEKTGKELNIFKVLALTYGPTIAFSGIIKIVADMLSFIGPLSIGGIVNFVTDTYYKSEDAPTKIISAHFVTITEFFVNGYVLVGVVFVSALLRHVLDQFYQYLVCLEGLHVRSSIQTMVYEKSMRMSTYALSGGLMTMGTITNHMSVDANNVMMFFQMSNEIWAVPLKITITVVLLYFQLGSPALIGCCLFFLTIPLQIRLGVAVAGIVKQVLQRADKRLKLSNEMLQAIKLLKLYGWEKLFNRMIEEARNSELAMLAKQYMIMTLNFILNFSTPVMVTLVAFGTYTAITGKPLTPDIAFTTLSLFGQIQAPLFILPFVINLLVNCFVSCRRLKVYFLAPEIEDDVASDNGLETTIRNGKHHSDDADHNGIHVSVKQPGSKKTFSVDYSVADDDKTPLLASMGSSIYGSTDSKKNMSTSFYEEIPDDVAIRISDGSFTWDPSSVTPILSDINVDIPIGKLTVIVGTVGSGKSSLLHAIMGEMTTIEGKVQINRTHKDIAYAAQKAWLVNTSLKDNILFGSTLQDSRYSKVISACALKQDIDMLPAGDQTEIGEKGINLSGGQKQRVSVARALYSRRDIIILDDPLSALDVHVGAHLFEQGISKILRKQNQTVILVTHQLQYLPEADLIIVMKDGCISTMGSPEEIEVSDPSLCSEWKRAVQIFSESESESGAESEGLMEERKALKRQIARTLSTTSITSESEENKKGRLIEKEEQEKGSVSYRIYLYYFRAMGFALLGLALFANLLKMGASMGTNFWLSAWSEYDLNLTGNAVDKTNYWIGGYAGLALTNIFMGSFTIAILTICSYRAAKNLHFALLNNIIHIPMRFFDTTPVGRILNRFSSDTQLIDMRLFHSIRMLINLASEALASLIVQVIIVWYFVFFFVPICALFVFLLIYYITTSRELQRCDSVTKSPVFAHFSESLGGLSTIRAYGSQNRFFDTILKRINTNNTVYLYLLTAQRWVGLRLDFLGDIIVFIASLCVVLGAAFFGIDSSLVGLAITYSLQISLYLNLVVRQCSDLELQMNSIERVKYYTEVPTEMYQGLDPPPNWPSQGSVEVDGVCVRYAKELDPVLHDVSFQIQSTDKLGICGRTGSGKSSLTLALFRMIDTFKGRIIIDGIDIATVPLRTLRQRISIIPQDAVLFTGTIRYNLDPNNEKTDGDLWKALEIAQLKEVVSNIESGLDYVVTEGGENFSVGQRQLFCLARAFLRNSKIIVMDEATASIDQETDRILQDVVADVFEDRTVLTIAHRVATILNSDTILTLNEGRVAEFDSPDTLLQRDGSIFASLVKAGK